MIASGIRQRVQEYMDGVLSGELVVSARVRDAVKRHLSDLAKQSTQDFQYYFDARWAEQVCQFFPIMCRHSIGEFAGHPFVLEGWQLFAVWCIFGWKRDSDHSRRFRKVYWSMARKNGKSSIAAGLCLFLGLGDIDPATDKPEAVAQILLTATKKEQAQVVYGEAERMRLQSPTIKKMSDVKYGTITFTKSQSYIRTVSSDKPFDGLNPHCVVMDELHAWGEHHRKFYDTMVTGSGSRTQPLHLIITTAGSDDSHLWIENYNYASSVVKGDFQDESLFAFICELDEEDDPADESKWIKANPNLGVSVKLDYLRERWNEDKNTAVGRNRFLRYHGNRIVSSTEAAFDLSKWDTCVGSLSDWSQADSVGAGVDLGARDDLAAYAMCARFPVESDSDTPVYRYEIRVKTYLARDSKRDIAAMPFASWVHTGEINVQTYPISHLQSDLIEDCTNHYCRTIAFDPYNGQQLSEDLKQVGITAARMPQNQSMFNEPIRDFIDLIEKGLIRFEHSKMLRWCAGNAIIASDRQDRWMFDKKSSKDKIDPIVAAVMAYRIASLAPARCIGPLYLS